ncbi:fibronectin type III domain-containing protein [Treponema primitia]|uniref:fibronectin type III domain-containing protein n=1 Tax=Treponema primitia TaxID=88058 RepID=UPI00397F109D
MKEVFGKKIGTPPPDRNTRNYRFQRVWTYPSYFLNKSALFFALAVLVFSACASPSNSDTTPPGVVSGLSGNPGDSQVILNWSNPSDSDFDHVEITFNPQTAAVNQPIIVPAGASTKTITGLANGTPYTFTVISVDASNNKSAGVQTGPHSPYPDDHTAPADVSGLGAIPGNSAVTLSWTDPSDSDLSYIEISFAPEAEGLTQPVSVAKGTGTKTITGFANGTAYTFTVKAVDASGNKSEGTQTGPHSPSGGFDPDDHTPPADINGLELQPGISAVTLSWIDPDDYDNDLSHIEISFEPETEGVTQPVNVPKGIGTKTITGLTGGVSYTFTVKAVDTSGNKSNGATNSSSPQSPDTTPPSSISSLWKENGNGQVRLSWNDPYDFDHIEITVEPKPAGITQPINVPKGTEYVTITGLTNGVDYTFTARTVDTSNNKSEEKTLTLNVGLSLVENLDIAKASADTNITVELYRDEPDVGTLYFGGEFSGKTITIKGMGAGKNTIHKGFSVESGVTLILEDIVITGGYSSVGVSGTLRMKGTTKKTGGTLPIGINGGTVIMDDYASISENENGVEITNGGSLTMNDYSTISNNNSCGVKIIGSGCSLTMKGHSSVKDNIGGGGVYLNSGTFTMNDYAVVSGNKSSETGGGVYLRSGTFTMDDYAAVTANSISSGYAFGGGVYVYGETSPTIFTMKGNAAVSNNTASKGGGVYVVGYTGEGVFNLTDSASVSENNAAQGGGVYVAEGSFIISGGKIEKNIASGDGGGIYVSSYSQSFSITGAIDISENTAAGNGGGIYSEKSFTLTDGVISGNNAFKGGGVYINQSGATFAMTGSAKVSGNNTAQFGGGVYIESGTFAMSDSAEVSENKAIKSDSSYGVLGGGVYVYGKTSPTSFTMSGSAKVSGNSSSGEGGGVYVYGETSSTPSFTINGGTVSNNTAYNGGGGVYIDNGNFTMNGGTVSNNTAYSGGGVYIYIYIYNGNFTMNGGTIYGKNEGANSNTTTSINSGASLYKVGYGTAKYGNGSDILSGDSTDDTLNGHN